jgi:hypothetical protein
MELYTKSINSELKKTIENISNNIFSNISNIDKRKIGYYNIYHSKWDSDKNNKYIDLIKNIIYEINSNNINENIEINKILYTGFIYSFPDCNDQRFHYDYSNKSETYFIPLINLTHENGTEFLSFHNLENNKKYVDLLNKINNKYLSKDDIIKYLLENNIDETEYEFKIYNCDAYSLYKLPKNIFHRGKKNTSDKIRIILQLVIINDTDYISNILSDELIINAELDDNNSLKDINTFYLLKFNEKFLKLSKRGKDYSYSEIEYCEVENNKIDCYKWYIKIQNNLYYIYHISGLLLNIVDNENLPFHFSIKFNEKQNWKLINNNQLSYMENKVITLVEI